MISHFYSDNFPVLFKTSRKFLSRIYKKLNSYLRPPKKHFFFYKNKLFSAHSKQIEHLQFMYAFHTLYLKLKYEIKKKISSV